MSPYDPDKIHVSVANEETPFDQSEAWVCGACTRLIVAEWIRNNKLVIDGLKGREIT